MIIDLLILVVVAIVAYWLITKFLTVEPARTIALIVAGVVLLIWLLKIVGVLGAVPSRLLN